MDKITLGKLGEDIASDYLVARNYEVEKRNFRAKTYGEVDIIALSPDKKTLVFVEVKTRVGSKYGNPEEAITSGKLHELKKMVAYYYNNHPEVELSPRIDALAITLDPNGQLLKVNHFENITL